MCAHWKKGYNPQFALQKLEADKKVSSKGEVGFVGNLFEDCVVLLGSSVTFSPDLPEDAARGIVTQAVFAAARENKLSTDWFTGKVSRLEEEYKRKPISQYTMAASISIKSRNRLAKIKSAGCTIRFGNDVSKVIQQKEKEYPRIFYQAKHSELPQDYMRIAVTTAGRSIVEAGWRALDSFDCYRAIWNLGRNRSRLWRISMGATPHPVNDIVLGPMQVLFKGDWTLIEDQWWYDRGYLGPVKALDVTGAWGDLRKYERKVMAKLRNSHCKDYIMSALRRYVRALDGRDYESVFLKLWSLLEHLTQSAHDSYDVTIRRAAFLWTDHEYHREILQHLRDTRNIAVHLDAFGEQGEALVYQLKRYVEALLEFIIFDGSKFKTKDELKHFLDLAPNTETLIAKNRLIRRGIKFRMS